MLLEAEFGRNEITSLVDQSSGHAVGGERRLMAAILTDGIETYLASFEPVEKNTLMFSCEDDDELKLSERFVEARHWIHCDEESYVFSFQAVCRALGIEPNYLRFGLERYVATFRESQGVSGWKKIRRQRNRT